MSDGDLRHSINDAWVLNMAATSVFEEFLHSRNDYHELQSGELCEVIGKPSLRQPEVSQVSHGHLHQARRVVSVCT